MLIGRTHMKSRCRGRLAAQGARALSSTRRGGDERVDRHWAAHRRPQPHGLVGAPCTHVAFAETHVAATGLGSTIGSRRRLEPDSLHPVARENPACSQSDRKQRIGFGGEGGIRTRSPPVDSVTYRHHVAVAPIRASVAAAPCTPLHHEALPRWTLRRRRTLRRESPRWSSA
jgi:hypothetical protein